MKEEFVAQQDEFFGEDSGEDEDADITKRSYICNPSSQGANILIVPVPLLCWTAFTSIYPTHTIPNTKRTSSHDIPQMPSYTNLYAVPGV
ncbi:hypothetical protein PHLCEN_2v2005 [Hermanssonia centrifuga]|uniref:Uncharacterized protein n=1 Tax=Hermanssonia centrifuga TaxID=98765 RepID=A0A2R6RQE1_9APHY|nr:hypothetical protein PHLCEN_2v2005 [Hermanssonia centrifuga]